MMAGAGSATRVSERGLADSEAEPAASRSRGTRLTFAGVVDEPVVELSQEAVQRRGLAGREQSPDAGVGGVGDGFELHEAPAALRGEGDVHDTAVEAVAGASDEVGRFEAVQ